MPSITERNLTFSFPAAWTVVKYDQLQFYLKEYQHVLKAKAVDILAVEPTVCCWLIEIKDFRLGHTKNAVDLADSVAQKVRDTLAGLATARVRATGRDQVVAQASMTCGDLRIVLEAIRERIIVLKWGCETRFARRNTGSAPIDAQALPVRPDRRTVVHYRAADPHEEDRPASQGRRALIGNTGKL